MPVKLQRLAAISWLLLVLLMATSLWYDWQDSPPLETSVLNLLPQKEHSALQQRAFEQRSERAAREVIFLIGHADADIARTAAQQYAQQLEASAQFSQVRLHVNTTYNAWQSFFFPYRYQLLDTRSEQQLSNHESTVLYQQALQLLYSPLNQPRTGSLVQDPLGLFNQWLLSRPALSANISVQQDMLTLQASERTYILLQATLAQNAFSLSYQQQVMPRIHNARQQLENDFPGLQILGSGLLLHASANAKQAQQEISTIGFGSLLGIVILLFSVFRSLRPLLLALLPIAAGILAATVICIEVFGNIHVLTMVFGASLVGVSIDYSLHYLCSRFEPVQPWTPQRGLRMILPGISLGLVSTVLAYSGIAWAPFPGLQQMALFAVTGLIAAWATVVAWFPLLSAGLSDRQPWFYHHFTSAPKLSLKPQHKIVLLALSVVFVLLMLGKVQSNDDIRLLQSSPQHILDQDRLVQQLTGTPLGHQFLILQAKDEQQLLEKMHRVGQQLQQLIQQGVLGQYQSLAQYVPTLQQQQQNYQLQQQLYDQHGPVTQLFNQIGAPALFAQSKQLYVAEHGRSLSLHEWISDPSSEAFRHLWLGEQDGQLATLITVSGVKGVNALQSIAHLHDPSQGIYFVDSVEDISQMMRDYREHISWLVAAAYLLVILLLSLRYRWQVWRVIFAPLLAGLLTLALLTLLGKSISVFNILAQLLVLGIGMDFGIFLQESRSSAATRLAITLSAMTTILSFGLLAFSQTEVLHTFGLTLVLGISLTWLIASLLGPTPSHHHTR